MVMGVCVCVCVCAVVCACCEDDTYEMQTLTTGNCWGFFSNSVFFFKLCWVFSLSLRVFVFLMTELNLQIFGLVQTQ